MQLCDGFIVGGLLQANGRHFMVTEHGGRWFAEQGIDIDVLRSDRRPLARRCTDWTERRPHVAGALGAAVLAWLVDAGWLRRSRGSRAVSLTPQGDRSLRSLLRHLASTIRGTGGPTQGIGDARGDEPR